MQHAYLITGPRHIGKTTLAQFLAQTLLCTSGTDRACGRCRACRLVQHGNHVDFRLFQPIDREGNVDRSGGMLRVDQAAEIIRDTSMRPVEGALKIFLIQDVHRANDNFNNKVLKTLEEPAPLTLLLLTADDRNNLLPTVVSRCQILPLRPLDMPTVRMALENNWHVEAERAELLARLASGRLGWAVQEAQRTSFLEERTETLTALFALVSAGRTERLTFAERLAIRRDTLAVFRLIDLWTTWWRDVMLVQAGCTAAICNVDHSTTLQSHADCIPAASVRQYLMMLKTVDGHLHHTVNVRLALDVLLLQLPKLSDNAKVC